MFQNKRYISAKVKEAIPLDIQNVIWEMIWNLGKKIRLDSEQFFDLKTLGNSPYAQVIEHCQTSPAYFYKRYFLFNHPVNVNIKVTDYGKFSLMALSHEK